MEALRKPAAGRMTRITGNNKRVFDAIQAGASSIRQVALKSGVKAEEVRTYVYRLRAAGHIRTEHRVCDCCGHGYAAAVPAAVALTKVMG